MVVFLPLINILNPRHCESFGAYFECRSTDKEIEPATTDSDALACQNNVLIIILVEIKTKVLLEPITVAKQGYETNQNQWQKHAAVGKCTSRKDDDISKLMDSFGFKSHWQKKLISQSTFDEFFESIRKWNPCIQLHQPEVEILLYIRLINVCQTC